jgi:hypothetical protein
MTECSSNQPGKCFCQCEGSKHTCRCSRLTIAALRAACSQIPAGCDRTAYVAALTVEYGTANGSHALEGLPARRLKIRRLVAQPIPPDQTRHRELAPPSGVSFRAR